jgi:Xaa-Pro aminopeptidase
LTEFEQRRQGVSAALGDRKIDALLVSSPASIRYLTGYAGSNGLVLVAGFVSHFFTDPRYETETKGHIDCKAHVCKGPLIDHAARIVKRMRLKRLGFEPGHMQVEQHEKLRKALPAGFALKATAGIVEDLRAIKSPPEIEKIRASVRANSEAYSRTLRRVRLGARECDVAAELDFQMRLQGAEKPAFDTIVAAGERTALPHAHPSGRKIEDTELLLIDMGATLDGYTSDMTRMSFMGTPGRRIRSLYKAVLEAQLAGLDAVRAGVAVSRVDAACREVLKRHELDRAFVHSTGHGLGLEIHEAPRIARKERTKLQAGMVITVEPGAYIEGLGGVRIEDTVLVTERGCEVLTPTSKELIQL